MGYFAIIDLSRNTAHILVWPFGWCVRHQEWQRYTLIHRLLRLPRSHFQRIAFLVSVLACLHRTPMHHRKIPLNNRRMEMRVQPPHAIERQQLQLIYVTHIKYRCPSVIWMSDTNTICINVFPNQQKMVPAVGQKYPDHWLIERHFTMTDTGHGWFSASLLWPPPALPAKRANKHFKGIRAVEIVKCHSLHCSSIVDLAFYRRRFSKSISTTIFQKHFAWHLVSNASTISWNQEAVNWTVWFLFVANGPLIAHKYPCLFVVLKHTNVHMFDEIRAVVIAPNVHILKSEKLLHCRWLAITSFQSFRVGRSCES